MNANHVNMKDRRFRTNYEHCLREWGALRCEEGNGKYTLCRNSTPRRERQWGTDGYMLATYQASWLPCFILTMTLQGPRWGPRLITLVGQARPQTVPVLFLLHLIAHFWWLKTWTNPLPSLGLCFSIKKKKKWNHWAKVIWHSLSGLNSLSSRTNGGDEYTQTRHGFSDTQDFRINRKIFLNILTLKFC